MSTNLTRPKVSVKLPEVKLTLADLAYLRGVPNDKSIRCIPSKKIIDKLLFLDLIARSKVPASPEKIQELEVQIECEISRLRTAIDNRNWNSFSSYGILNLERQLQPKEDFVLTERGKELLEMGQTDVNVRKVGCLS